MEFHVLLNVKSMVDLVVCRVWAIRCTTLLCLYIIGPFK